MRTNFFEEQLGVLSDAEKAAIEFIETLSAICHGGLGIGKWELIQSRVSVAAARAETPPQIWEELSPQLRSISDTWSLVNDRTVDILKCLNVPGVQEVLASSIELTVLRVRAINQLEKGN